MQTTFTFHGLLSVPSRASACPRPFRAIVLLACAVLATSACETTRPTATADRQQTAATSTARLEPIGAAQELFDRGQALIQQGKAQEGAAALNELDRRFGQDPRRPVRALLAQALSLKAQTAATPTESFATQVEIGRRYGDDIDPALRKQIVTAMFNQGAAKAKAGDLSAAISIYKEIEQTYAGSDAAWAISYQGDLQRQMRNPKAAAAAYARLDQRLAQDSDPAVRAIVADTLSKKAETLVEQGDTRAAIAAYDEIDRRYSADRDASFRLRAARALFAKGSLLGKQGAGEETGGEISGMGIRPTGDTAAAVAVYDDIVQRFGRDKDPSIRNIVGATLLKKSEAFRLVGNDQGMIAVYGDIVEHFGDDNAQVSRVLVATALFRKGLALGRQPGAANEAIAAFDEVTRRFASDPNPNLRKIVGQAVTARQRLHAAQEPMYDN
ncbi:MAG: hypothetical protein LBU76_09715 [Azoarcus sp.]|jgi:tetratricopeptide (TPR) repeat protein|nr:hypothetical protein [Azoarcus sp.]